MEQNSPSSPKIKDKIRQWFKRILSYLTRWFFMISVFAAALFCVFAWYRFVWKADWDEAKKQSYVSEQAKFSFDKAGYQKIVDLMKNRQDKLENFPKFTGRDVFFPKNF